MFLKIRCFLIKPYSKEIIIDYLILFSPLIASGAITLLFLHLNILNNIVHVNNSNSATNGLNVILEEGITIPLSLVALIIPLNLLVINAITSKNPSFVVSYYFDKLKPLETLIVVVFSLTGIIFLYFLSFSNSNFLINLSNYFPYLEFLLILISVFQSALLVLRTLKLLTNDGLYEFIIKKFVRELIEHVMVEKVSKNVIKSFIEKSDSYLIKIDNSLNDLYKPNDLINIESSNKIDFKSFITKIDYESLERLRDIIKNPISDQLFGVIIIPPPKMSYSSSIKFYTSEVYDMDKLKSNFDKIFKIENIDIKPFLDEIKDSLIDSINKNEESKLEKLINIYFEGLIRYMIFIDQDSLKSNDKNFLKSKEQFRSLKLICYDLDDILKSSIKSSNARMVEIFGLKFFKISQESIYYKDYSVLKIFLSSFETFYDYSYEYKNKRGKQISIKYLVKIIRYLNEIKVKDETEEKFKNISLICKQYDTILDHVLIQAKKNNESEMIKEFITKKYIKKNILENYLKRKLALL